MELVKELPEIFEEFAEQRHTGQHFLPEKKRIKGDNEDGTD